MAQASSSSTSLSIFRRSIPSHVPFYSSLQTYTPSAPSGIDLPRPPRPSTPTFFTGRPSYFTALSTLQSAVQSTQQSLRKQFIYPLPSTLPTPQPPRASWLSSAALSNLLSTKLKTSNHRRIVDLLNELHQLRYIAELSERGDVVDELDHILGKYERPERMSNDKISNKGDEIDEFGRSYGMGRRKESSARVWVIPSKAYLNSTDVSKSEIDLEEMGQILINHSPLSSYFPKLADREAVIRPLKITGLLGAFNIFALTRGGGTTGQAGAVGLGLARALSIIRGDTTEVLIRDGALMRDTRTVERKKTGNEKARKKYAWVKR